MLSLGLGLKGAMWALMMATLFLWQAHPGLGCGPVQVRNPPEAPYEPCVCGVSKNRIRIVGGNISDVNEFPWQVGLVSPGNRQFIFCGGSLISDQWVLTAAHCVFGQRPRSFQILLGEHDVTTQSESRLVVKNVRRIEVHPKFDLTTIDSDFALMMLESPVDFGQDNHVRPICLTSLGPRTGATAIVSGWGTTYEGSRQTSNQLRKAKIDIFSDEKCKELYKDQTITDTMFCAGLVQGQVDACQGDSGGPLVTQTPGKHTLELIGVTSWGIGCGRAGQPGVYASVLDALPWIQSHVGHLGCP